MNTSEAVTEFTQQGFVILRELVPPAICNFFLEDLAYQVEANPNLTFSEYGKLFKQSELTPLERRRMRIIDLEVHSSFARYVALHPNILLLLTAIYHAPASCLQTLTYIQSSQQGAHSDKYLVSPPWFPTYNRETLAAAWIACEDADESNGCLIVYPRSHLFSKPDLINDCAGNYGEYVRRLEALCAENGCIPQPFIARKGDVLFWHGDFVHAGGPILVPGASRTSFVIHYARQDDARMLPPGERVYRKFVSDGGMFLPT
jgi:ectoine hydroxylase-related dioxygenase (phytanoyl-CoA dioxygenase family)